MSAWKQTGKKPKELEDLVELPDSCLNVWHWFISLNNARSNSGFGVNPISYTEIKNFFELMHIVPDEWEVNLIKAMDAVAMKQFSEDMARQNKNKQK